jgi:uncharacterized protein YoxC
MRMNRPVAVSALVALLVGLLAGFLWWGMSDSRLQAELDDARSRAGRLEQQLQDVQTRTQQLQTQVKTMQDDLNREKELNSRLNELVSRGKK